MSQQDIIDERQRIQNEINKHNLEIQTLNEELEKLRNKCSHPNAYDYSRWGGRDEGTFCPDCEKDY